MERRKKKELRENSGIWFYASPREDLPFIKGQKSLTTVSLMAEVLNTENWDVKSEVLSWELGAILDKRNCTSSCQCQSTSVKS